MIPIFRTKIAKNENSLEEVLKDIYHLNPLEEVLKEIYHLYQIKSF